MREPNGDGDLSLDEASRSNDVDGVLTGEAAPANIAELAEGCVRFVTARFGVALDYTSDTLSLLDQWVRDARRDPQAKPEATRIVEAAGGAYLGEVMRRSFGGHWRAIGAESGWLLLLSNAFCSFNPIAMVREAIALAPAEGWHAHMDLDPSDRDAVEARLAALPEVDDDEYYAPSTRFDVVEMVVDTLRAMQRSRGHGDVRFEAEDYPS
ncbi:MAG: DUF6278 family protein [Polyangiaceae bacterium]